MSEFENQQEKKGNRILWFIFVFLVPFIFAVITTGVVLQFAGIDVLGKVKEVSSNLPFIASDKKGNEMQRPNLTDQIEELTKALDESKDAIKQLNTAMEVKEKEIENLKLENETIRNETKENNNVIMDAEKKQKLILDVYENMDAKKAALILKEMPENQVEIILSRLSSEVLSELFANMDPKDAAKFTALLTN